MLFRTCANKSNIGTRKLIANIYLGAHAFLIISENAGGGGGGGGSAIDSCAKKYDCSVGCISLLLPKLPNQFT